MYSTYEVHLMKLVPLYHINSGKQACERRKVS